MSACSTKLCDERSQQNGAARQINTPHRSFVSSHHSQTLSGLCVCAWRCRSSLAWQTQTERRKERRETLKDERGLRPRGQEREREVEKIKGRERKREGENKACHSWWSRACLSRSDTDKWCSLGLACSLWQTHTHINTRTHTDTNSVEVRGKLIVCLTAFFSWTAVYLPAGCPSLQPCRLKDKAADILYLLSTNPLKNSNNELML